MVDDVPGQKAPTPALLTVTGPAVRTAAGIVGIAGPAGAAVARDRVALVVDGGGTLTYGEWDSRSNRVARGLTARGLVAGDRVGLLFDGRHWVDFAVGRSGVLKAGGVAVLLSPGAAPAGLTRAVAHAGAVGLLCAGRPSPPAMGSVWVAAPESVAAGHRAGPPAAGIGSCGPADLVYPRAPLAPPVPLALGVEQWAADGLASDGGWFVHAWAPGSVAGWWALGLMQAASHRGVLALGAFDPGRLCAAVVARQATGCGLTPALAAALLASGAAKAHDLSAVAEVVLSGAASREVVAGLRAAFPGAALRVLGGGRAQPAATVGARSAPVAVSQEGMLWHEQFTPGSFNLPCLVRRYQGPLDFAALEWALSELVRRHEPLRSTFAVVDGRPRQVVHPHRPVALRRSDLGDLGDGDREAEAGRLLADATRRPFDLATGPLCDPHLVRLGPDDHLLVVRLHHTVFDDWSVDLFRRELSALYAAGTAGQPSPLLPPPATFADVAEGEQAALAGDAGEAERSWWRRELDGAPLAVQLPLGGDDGDEGDPDDRSGAGEPLRVDLPPSLVEGLRRLAPRLRATPFMTVLAAFSALASGLTGQDDLVIATVVAHRDAIASEPLIGCFTKKVPLRLRTGGDPTFAALVARTRSSLLGSLAHQDLGFEAAVHAGLGPAAAEHGVVPHLAVVFQGETPRRAGLALPGLTTGPYEARAGDRRERHFSTGPDKSLDDRALDDRPTWGDGTYGGTFLILSLLDTASGMALVARGVFSRPATAPVLDDFVRLLVAAAADPSRPISGLGAAHRRRARPDDVVDVRGFRARRSHLEGALSRCPGVAEVAVATRDDGGGGGARLVAYVVPDGDGPPPTLAALRRAVWAERPGLVWPAAVVVVDALPRLTGGILDVDRLPPATGVPADPDPLAVVLSAMWGEIGRRPVSPDVSYWQDFSFLEVLAEAREAGLDVADEQVVRCRTPATLAAAVATSARPSSG